MLDLADELWILMLDESFDTWQVAKAVNDFSLIFTEWYEADLRSFCGGIGIIRPSSSGHTVMRWRSSGLVMLVYEFRSG